MSFICLLAFNVRVWRQVIAHPAVQRYLTDVWMGSLDWPGWKVIIMFLAFLFLPPVWIFFRYNPSQKQGSHFTPLALLQGYYQAHTYIFLSRCSFKKSFGLPLEFIHYFLFIY